MQKVLVPLAEGFEEVEALAIVDVLRRGGVEVVTASLVADRTVPGAHGVRVVADAVLTEVLEADYAAIILPGGGKGTENLKACEPLLARLRRQKEAGHFVCAICAAPTVLEAADVLTDETVTCYPSCASLMRRRVAPVPVVADDQVITGQGPGSAMLFALVVLSHLTDERTAHSVANGLIVDFS